MAALTKTAASLSALGTAASALISLYDSNAAALAAAKTTLDETDNETSASIDAVTAQINGALSAPTPVGGGTATTQEKLQD